MRSLIFCPLAAAWLAVLVAPTSGAEIRSASPAEFQYAGSANLIMEGKIETGDYDMRPGRQDAGLQNLARTRLAGLSISLVAALNGKHPESAVDNFKNYSVVANSETIGRRS